MAPEHHPQPQRYGAIPIALHWLTLLLVVAACVAIELHEAFPRGSALRDGLQNGHFSLGLTILAVTLVRLAVNRTTPPPGIVPPPPPWQQRAARGVHIALYALLIGLPIVGYLAVSARGRPVPLFGLDLPSLLAENRQLGRGLRKLHEVGGNLGYALVGAHAAAALFHHYIARDNALRRMLPGRLRSPTNSAAA